jgi:hypothetical protein
MACGYAKFGGLNLLTGRYDAKLDGQPVARRKWSRGSSESGFAMMPSSAALTWEFGQALRLLTSRTLEGESLRAVVELCRVDVAPRIDRHVVRPNGSSRSETVTCQNGERLSIHDKNLIALSDIQELLLFVRRQGETAR